MYIKESIQCVLKTTKCYASSTLALNAGAYCLKCFSEDAMVKFLYTFVSEL